MALGGDGEIGGNLSCTKLRIVPENNVCVCAQPCLTLCDPMECSMLAPLSMEFSRQVCWSRLPFPTPGDLLDPGIKPAFPAGRLSATEPPGKPA